MDYGADDSERGINIAALKVPLEESLIPPESKASKDRGNASAIEFRSQGARNSSVEAGKRGPSDPALAKTPRKEKRPETVRPALGSAGLFIQQGEKAIG
jgi:hypothetical protein